MKQKQRRQHTLQLLLNTTKELIQEKGCESITIQDIMDRSKLSKGAIFHYVNSKDEIYAKILQDWLEDTDLRFTAKTKSGKKEFDGPMHEITASLPLLQDRQDITNQILIYLLGKSGRPEIDEVLTQFYEQWMHFATVWIESGQQHGVIPDSIQAAKTGELFILLSLGMRMRSFLTTTDFAFNSEDFVSFMTETLKRRDD